MGPGGRYWMVALAGTAFIAVAVTLLETRAPWNALILTFGALLWYALLQGKLRKR